MTAFYNDLDQSFAEARSFLEDGVKRRHSAAHSPTVATVNAQGAPTQRIMILRSVDWENRLLRFHTDARSNKVDEVGSGASASVLVYLPEPKIQIRLEGIAMIEQSGSRFDAAWDASTPFARRCYMAEAAPGTMSLEPTSGLPSAIEGVQPSLEDIAPAKENFALFLVKFSTVEWLYLANSGHRRARWAWDNAVQDWQGSWLVP
jgi:pyridoxamine 5'-phosphate oxidase